MAEPVPALPFRVLEMASFATAPCGRMLAEAGVGVIKVEPPGGSQERTEPPFVVRNGVSTGAYSLFHDAGKRSITLAAQHDEGSALLKRLISQADVLVESFSYADREALGLSFEELGRLNPAFVTVSITPFGQTGPYSAYQGDDLVAFAMGGLMFISGLPGRPPVVAPDRQGYVVAGSYAALATMAALWARRSTGTAEHIDISVMECLVALDSTVTGYQGPGKFLRRMGSQHRSQTVNPGQVVPCKDGYLYLYVRRDKGSWQRFLQWLGNPPELADESLADSKVRWDNRDRIMDVTRSIIKDRTRAELYESAQAKDLAFVPVNSPAEFAADPQNSARHFVREVPHAQLGTYRTLRSPLAGPESADGPRPAPALGQHNAEVYGELLGLSSDELDECRERGVV